MANKDDYLAVYQRFFDCFAQTVNPNDQLPVKLASYKLVNLEVVGGIIDWTTQYLTQKQCPASLVAPLIKIVIEEIRKNCKKNPIGCGYNTSAEVYEPLKLMQAVMAKTNEVCLRYMDNSMLCSLPTPGPPHYIVSVAAIKNSRRKMEDRHVVIHDLNTMFNIQEASPSSYYAIFDGHAGHDAAAYSAVHLHQFLAESKHFVNNPEQALIDAFYKTDALFIDKEEFCSGTTAVCVLLKPKERMLYIAWVGDSQALIVSKGVLYQCVVPHKPGREDEKIRIEQQGGAVVYWGTWRVNGQLAVSRAIGDREYKPYVTAIPEVQEIPVTANTDFIIVACDGLWDFLSEEEAATTVYNMVCTNSDDTDSISHRLVQLAKNQGSTDNISVIVVFLREPTKVAADAHWANRNTTTGLLPTTMETGLDNANAANNPFANSNGAEILQQKDDFLLNQPKDDYLLNLTEGFKQNGADIASQTTNNVHFTNFDLNSANGKRQSMDEFDEDEDMGPETDVDAVDDIPSPMDVKQMIFHQDSEENQKENAFNPFVASEEKGAFEVDMELELEKQKSEDIEEQGLMREETPTPPADKVHDATVEENVADSGEESEDEWNYFKGNSAEAETSASSLKIDQEVAELTKTIEEDEEQDMSQLNPNAAEFVPISSPTRNISSPACRALIDDQVIAQSPRRATPIDINVPDPVEFESEVKNKPSEVFNNGHDSENGHKLSSQEVMENLLNGKNMDEIEFYPSTPSKIVNPNPEEFHFGPNATPFSTPAKPLDQSEALSTKANFGDESTASYLEGHTLEGTTLEGTALESTTLMEPSTPTKKEEEDVLSVQNLKEQDPMSMSFYQDETEHNPFDLNQVQQLPENVDEFIGGSENGKDNQKENVDPELLNEDLLGVSQLPETPEPENLSESVEEKEDTDVEKDLDYEKVEEVLHLPPAVSPSLEEVAKQPLPITPEPSESLQEENIVVHEKEEQHDIVVHEKEEQHSIVVHEKEQHDIVDEKEEVDLLKFSDTSLPTTNLDTSVTDETVVPACDFRKASEIDSSPETEELSQISDEVPLVCKSPEVTSDLDQFESDSKEVIPETPDICSINQTETNIDLLQDGDTVVEMVTETVVEDVGLFPKSEETNMEKLSQMVSCTKMADFDLLGLQKGDEVPATMSGLAADISDFIEIVPIEKLNIEPITTNKEDITKAIKGTEELFGTSLEIKPTVTNLFFSDKSEKIEQGGDISDPFKLQSPEPSNEILMLHKDIDSYFQIEALELKVEDKVSDDVRDLDSPMEDITTSVKDDISSSEIIEEAKDISTEKDIIIQDSFVIGSNELAFEISQTNIAGHMEEIAQTVMETVTEEIKEEIEQTEKFLEHSNIPDILSPLCPVALQTENIIAVESKESQESEQVTQETTTELVKTDTITRQFPEETTIILTPSEEVKLSIESVSATPEEIELPKPDDADKTEIEEQPVVTTTSVASTAVAAEIAAVTAKSKDKKLIEKKSATKTTTTRKSTPVKTASTSTSSKPLTSKPSTRSIGSKSQTSPTKLTAPTSKTALPKTSKPLSTVSSSVKTTTRATSTKPSTKPEPSAAVKIIEKKTPLTLTNGEVKCTMKVSTKKTSTVTKTPSTTPKTAQTKVSPTKVESPKVAAKPPSKVTMVNKTTMVSTKPRPTNLTSTVTNGATKPSTTSVKSTSTKGVTASFPKLGSATQKPRPSSAPSAKLKQPASSTKPKLPDTEKQIKDSVNKQLTTSRGTRMSSSSGTSRVSSPSTAGVKKAESKATTRTTKTTTTTIKATKKPVEITRLSGKVKPVATTKTNAVAPQENGVTTEHIVQETTAILTAEPQLLKDLSPLENKFIIDNLQVTDSHVAD